MIQDIILFQKFILNLIIFHQILQPFLQNFPINLKRFLIRVKSHQKFYFYIINPNLYITILIFIDIFILKFFLDTLYINITLLLYIISHLLNKIFYQFPQLFFIYLCLTKIMKCIFQLNLF